MKATTATMPTIAATRPASIESWPSSGPIVRSSRKVIFAGSDDKVSNILTGTESTILNNVLNDVVNIEKVNSRTFLNLGGGNDLVRVNYDDTGKQTFLNGVQAEIDLDGGNGSDRYDIGLSGLGAAVILERP